MSLEEEIRLLRQDVEYIKGVLADFVDDSALTSDGEAVYRGDLSDFSD